MKKLDILYEDNDIIVVNKKTKVLTIANNSVRESLYEEVSNYLKKKNKNNKVYIVHRLDKDTSGIVLFAKNEKVKYALQDNWSKVIRKYVAVVEGVVTKKRDRLENYLKETKTFYVYVAKDGKKAITNYELITSNKKYSLLSIKIETGRKNQIRVQLSNIGYPIVGDKKYGAKTNPLKRILLHACYIEFEHPTSKQIIKLESKIPEEFKI